MKATIFSKKEFDNMEPLILSNDIHNTECNLYRYHVKDKWETKNMLLKRLYVTSGPMFGNKLKTLNSLIDNSKYLTMPELVLPETIAIVDSDVVGSTMPEIDSINLIEILNDLSVSFEDKISYLKQVGIILEKIKKIREHTPVIDFYLNDLHETNFIVDKNDGILKTVDLDSCKIGDNAVFGSKYLSHLSAIKEIKKYHQTDNGFCGGYYEINENTDLYCYIIMILNFLYKGNVNRLSLTEIYDFFSYLEHIGLPLEIINILLKPFSNEQNENPYELLDVITPYVARARVYQKIKK